VVYQSGPATGTQQTPEQKAAALIRQEGSVYFQAWSQQTENFAQTASGFFDSLKLQSTQKAGMSDFAYFQAMVRNMKLSSAKGVLGMSSTEDIAAMKEVLKNSYLDGIDWVSYINTQAQSPYASSSSGPRFSKEVSTALTLIDKTDAESILSKAYYGAFGVMPNNKQIENFKTRYNAEAQRQLAETTSTRSTSGTDTSTAARSKSVTEGMGFTQQEQQQFIAKFLKNNYKITGKEESGRAATIIDDLQRVYEDNLMPVPPIEELAAFAANAIGTGDPEMYKQKIDAKLQAVRMVAAKMHPGAADILSAGTDIKTIATPISQALNSYMGTNIAYNDPRIKELVNYNDGTTIRTANAIEIEKWARKQPEFATSAYGKNRAMDIADAFEQGLK
jgi:hypothetical protein